MDATAREKNKIFWFCGTIFLNLVRLQVYPITTQRIAACNPFSLTQSTIQGHRYEKDISTEQQKAQEQTWIS